MELTQAMETRRSTRGYQPGRPVNREDLEALLLAAQQAPSWKNSQTGRYYVITSPEMLARVKTGCLPERNAKNCADAPALSVVAFEKGLAGFTEGVADNESGDQGGAYDLGLQCQNLMRKATQLGLGTLVMGPRYGDALRALLNIPDSQQVMAVISVGYPAVEPKKPRRKELEEIAGWF